VSRKSCFNFKLITLQHNNATIQSQYWKIKVLICCTCGDSLLCQLLATESLNLNCYKICHARTSLCICWQNHYLSTKDSNQLALKSKKEYSLDCSLYRNASTWIPSDISVCSGDFNHFSSMQKIEECIWVVPWWNEVSTFPFSKNIWLWKLFNKQLLTSEQSHGALWKAKINTFLRLIVLC